MAGFLSSMRSLALLLARIGLGGVLILHGWRRWQVQGVGSQVTYLKQFGTPFANYAAWGGTILELVGGIFLIVGALTPLVAAAIVVEQALIIAYTSWYKNWNLVDVHGQQATWNGGWEYNLILGLLAMLIMVFGSGAIGVDRLFRRRSADDEEADTEPEPEQRQRLARRTEPGQRPAGPSSPDPAGSESQVTSTV
jgi:putative oxidoreductase